jgi:hypothetical protein
MLIILRQKAMTSKSLKHRQTFLSCLWHFSKKAHCAAKIISHKKRGFSKYLYELLLQLSETCQKNAIAGKQIAI